MTTHPSPEAVAVLLAAERARITDALDTRISEWWQFHHEHGDEFAYLIIAELDRFRSVINVSDHPNRPRNL